MKQILALSLVSILFAAAGCAVGPEPSPSESTSRSSLDGTPGALDAAERLTHDLRLQSGSEPNDGDATASLPAASTGAHGEHANVTSHVICDRTCIRGCGPLGDEACAHSCCIVIVTTL